MTIPLAWSFDWGPLTTLLFGIGGALIAIGALLLWVRPRWALPPMALGLLPIGLSIAGQVPAMAGRPALTVTTSHIACTPWSRAVAWADVADVLTESQKMRRGWKDVGFELVLKPALSTPDPAAPPIPDSGPWLFLTRFSRTPIVAIGTAPEPSPGGHLYCQTLDVAAEPGVLKRLAQELMWASAWAPEPRVGLAWCETSGNLTWPCVSNAERWHRYCTDRGGDYDACRRSGL